MAKTSKKKDAPEEKPLTIDDMVSSLVEGIEDGCAQTLGSDELKLKIRGVIPTGCCLIDDATGRGGIPLGRLTLVEGKEAGGKTTLALQVVAECQKMGGIALYMDHEYKLDPDYAKMLGVDTKRLIISQPGYLEKSFEVMSQTIKRVAEMRKSSGQRIPILIVLDSMNAVETLAEAEATLEKQHYASAARVFTSGLKRLIPEVSHEDVALLFISQIRTDIGVTYGSKDKSAGGRAPKFYASLALSVRPEQFKNDGDEKISNQIVLECIKNQIAPPFKKARYDIVYGKGINSEKALIDWAIKHEIVEQRGAWFNYGEIRLGQGMPKACEKLIAEPELEEEIYQKCRAKVAW